MTEFLTLIPNRSFLHGFLGQDNIFWNVSHQNTNHSIKTFISFLLRYVVLPFLLHLCFLSSIDLMSPSDLLLLLLHNNLLFYFLLPRSIDHLFPHTFLVGNSTNAQNQLWKMDRIIHSSVSKFCHYY